MEIVVDERLLKPGEHIIILVANAPESEKEEIFRYTMPRDNKVWLLVKRIEIGKKATP